MKEKQMLQISAWLDCRLEDQEKVAFEQKMGEDPTLAQECKEMAAMLEALSSLDLDLSSSPQFHNRLMQRLTAEQAAQGAATAPLKDEKKQNPADQRVFWQRLKSKLGKNKNGEKGKTKGQWRLPAWLPVAATACGLLVAIGVFSPYAQANQDNKSAGGARIEQPEASPRMEDAASPANTFAVTPKVETSSLVPPKNQQQKIIYNGQIDLKVTSYDQVAKELKGIVESFEGYVTSEQCYHVENPDRLAGSLCLRVPVNQFTSLIEAASRLGKINGQSTKAQDVTTEFVDGQARLQVMGAKEARLLELLNQAANLTEILAVEQELADTRAELESLQGQLRYLSNQTDYATLDVNLEEKPLSASSIQMTGFTGLWQRSREAFMMGFNGLLDLASDSLVWLIGITPLLLVLLLISWLLWHQWLGAWWRKRRD